MPADQVDGKPRGASPLRLAAQGPRGSGAESPELREKALVRRLAELEAEVTHLRRGLDSRTHIAIAIGMLAERFRCTSSQAWSLLQRLSSHTNLKLRRVADLIVAEAHDTCLETDRADLARLATHVPGLLHHDQDDEHPA